MPRLRDHRGIIVILSMEIEALSGWHRVDTRSAQYVKSRATQADDLREPDAMARR